MNLVISVQSSSLKFGLFHLCRSKHVLMLHTPALVRLTSGWLKVTIFDKQSQNFPTNDIMRAHNFNFVLSVPKFRQKEYFPTAHNLREKVNSGGSCPYTPHYLPRLYAIESHAVIGRITCFARPSVLSYVSSSV